MFLYHTAKHSKALQLSVILIALTTTVADARTTFDTTRNMWVSEFGWRTTMAKVVVAIWAEEEAGYVSLCGNVHARGSGIAPWLTRTLNTSSVSLGNRVLTWNILFVTEVSDQSQFGSSPSRVKTDVVWRDDVNQSSRISINGNRYLKD